MMIWTTIIEVFLAYFIVSAYVKLTKSKSEKDIQKEKDKSVKESENTISIITTNDIRFSCVGETADNENGENRQKIIERIAKNYKRENFESNELFGGYTNKEIKEELYNEKISEFENLYFDGTYKESEYEGHKCFIILMEDVDGKQYEVANIARKDIKEFTELINNNEVLSTQILLTGGKVKYSDYDDYGKEIVSTDKLYYGVVLELSCVAKTGEEIDMS